MVDTGNAGSSSGDLQRETFAALVKQGMLKPNGEGLVQILGGKIITERDGRVDAIALAGFRHENLLFDEFHESALKLNYLSRFVVTFDFPHKAIYLKKGRQYDRPDVCDLSGLGVIRRNGQTLVEAMDEDGPAARAGVKPQDELLMIDDRNAREMSLYSIRRAFCAESKKYSLLIRRGEKELVTDLVLPNQQP